jgi:DNA replication and repair protein RecF
VKHGGVIAGERRNLIRAISANARKYFENFTRGSKLSLTYLPKIAAGFAETAPAIEKLLVEYRDRELRAGATLAGPHRDRLDIAVNNRSVRHYGSRGQKRCAMIAMKLAAADYLTMMKDEPVTLVLDEVFAELDADISRALVGILANYKQVFMATANKFPLENCKVTRFFVENGSIERIDNDAGN